MFTKPSYPSVFLASGPAGKIDIKQHWRHHALAPWAHLWIGAACAAAIVPFGLMAAALAPVAIGFAKGIFDHHTGKDADPANFVWVLAGAALVVSAVKLAGLA